MKQGRVRQVDWHTVEGVSSSDRLHGVEVPSQVSDRIGSSDEAGERRGRARAEKIPHQREPRIGISGAHGGVQKGDWRWFREISGRRVGEREGEVARLLRGAGGEEEDAAKHGRRSDRRVHKYDGVQHQDRHQRTTADVEPFFGELGE